MRSLQQCLLILLALVAIPAFSQQPEKSYKAHGAVMHGVNPQPLLDNGAWNNDIVITHIADGAGWRSTIKLVNLSQVNAADFTVNLFGDDGSSVTFPFSGSDIAEGPGNYSSFSLSLPPGGSATFQTAGGSTLTEGYGLIGAAPSLNVSGYGIFTYQNGSEAVVPFEAAFPTNPGQVLAFDNTGGYGIGAALVNLTMVNGVGVPITVTAFFYDENGNAIGSPQHFSMTAHQHASFVFTDLWPFTANQKGTVFFEFTPNTPGGSGLVVLGLRFTPNGTFTSIHALTEMN